MAHSPDTKPSFLILVGLTIITLTSFSGCQKQQTKNDDDQKESTIHDSQPITVVILDADPASAKSWTSAIEKEFEALDLGDVSFEFKSGKEFLKVPSEGDLIFYAPQYFGDLVDKKLVRRIPAFLVESEAYSDNDVLKLQREIFCVHDDTRFAVSLGIASFFLMVRVDLLEQNGLSVPEDWRDYEEVCKELSRLRKAGKLKGVRDDIPFSPTLEPFHADWLATTFYARSAGYVRTRGCYSVLFDYLTWKPLINSKPFLQALKELRTIFELTDSRHRGLTPEQIEDAFWRGESAMAITWPHPSPSVVDPKVQTGIQAGIFPIPGSKKKYDRSTDSWVNSPKDERSIPVVGVGGLCGSVLTSSKKSGVAMRRLGLLAGKEFSSKIGPGYHASFPHRASHLGNLGNWVAASYRSNLLEQFSEQLDLQNNSLVWMVRPQLQKFEEYEIALSKQIQKCFAEQSIEESLIKVEQKWQEINKEVDLEFQKQISLENLGIR